MNKEKAMENRSQDRKALGGFIILIIAGAIVGAILGATSVWSVNIKEHIANVLPEILMIASPIVPIILNTVLIITMVVVLKKSRRAFADWDGENEEQMDKIEQWLGYGMIAVSVDMILGFFFFGAGVYSGEVRELETKELLFFCLNLFSMIYTLVVVTILQNRIVNMEKEINPEKQGSVYDTKFQKVWLESCDEAERQTIYKAAYKAYQVTNSTCMGLWLFSVLGAMLWNFGIMPLTMVSLIWLVMTVSYGIESMRLSKHSK